MLSSAVIFASYGNAEFNLGDKAMIKLTLTDHEHTQIVSMLERFYAERQRALSELVAMPVPQLADYSEALDA